MDETTGEWDDSDQYNQVRESGDAAEDARHFKEMVDLRWTKDISALTHSTLRERKWVIKFNSLLGDNGHNVITTYTLESLSSLT